MAIVRAVPGDSEAARWLGRYPSWSMTCCTETRDVSRTFAAPFMTRETVPPPAPGAAPTSAMVGRRGDCIVTLQKRTVGTGSTESDPRRPAPSHRQEAISPGRLAAIGCRGVLRDIWGIVPASG